MAPSLTQLREIDEARAWLVDFMRLRPDFSISAMPRFPVGREFLSENLRRAGLRE